MTNEGVKPICQADESVVQNDRQFDARILSEKRVQRRGQMQHAKTDGCRDSQRPDQLTSSFSRLRGSLGNFAEDASCAFKQGATVFGQCQLARRSTQQRGANSALKFGQTLAGNGFRNLQASRCLADRAGLRSRDEGKKGIQLQHRSVFPDACSFDCSLVRTLAQG